MIADDLIADDLIADDLIADDLIADDLIADDLIADDLERNSLKKRIACYNPLLRSDLSDKSRRFLMTSYEGICLCVPEVGVHRELWGDLPVAGSSLAV